MNGFQFYVLNKSNSVRVINLVLHNRITENTSIEKLKTIKYCGKQSLPKILKLQASYKIEKENELTWRRNKKYDEL